MYDRAYFYGTLFWVLVYVVVYLCFRRGRRAMLWTGLLYCFAGPVYRISSELAEKWKK